MVLLTAGTKGEIKEWWELDEKVDISLASFLFIITVCALTVNEVYGERLNLGRKLAVRYRLVTSSQAKGARCILFFTFVDHCKSTDGHARPSFSF